MSFSPFIKVPENDINGSSASYDAPAVGRSYKQEFMCSLDSDMRDINIARYQLWQQRVTH